MALKIGILGAGAIGASIARALYLNQVPFRLLTRSEARAREYNQTGIRFRSGKELTLIRLGVDQPHFAEEVGGRGDLDYLFLGMKTPALAASLPQAWRELGPEGRIVLLQNGLPEDTLPLSDRERERIVAGIVGYNVQRLSDGVFYQSNPGHLILGAAREPRARNRFHPEIWSGRLAMVAAASASACTGPQVPPDQNLDASGHRSRSQDGSERDPRRPVRSCPECRCSITSYRSDS